MIQPTRPASRRNTDPVIRATLRELDKLAIAIYNGAFIWTDDDDNALCHVRLMERELAHCAGLSTTATRFHQHALVANGGR